MEEAPQKNREQVKEATDKRRLSTRFRGFSLAAAAMLAGAQNSSSLQAEKHAIILA